jgi:tetratricopeptide (TPR) repeat protein
MRIFNTAINLILLFVTPSFLIYPKGISLFVDILQIIPFEKLVSRNTQLSSYNFRYSADITYDHILDLLDALENDNLEEPFDSAEFARINQFIGGLAKEGILEKNDELLKDIHELLNEEDIVFFSSIDNEYQALPAVMKMAKAETVFCKSSGKKTWQKTKKFVKKHKKEIIIGAAIVVAATVIVVVVVTAASAGAAAGTAAAVAGSGGSSTSGGAATGLAALAGVAAASSEKEKKKDSPEDPPTSSNGSSHTLPTLKEFIEQEKASFKSIAKQESLFETAGSNGLSIEESGRTLGALFAHEGLEKTNRAISNNATLAHEVNNLGSHTFFENYKTGQSLDQNHINTRFKTDYSYLYQKGAPLPDYTTLAYQMRGEKALQAGFYSQAVGDLSQAIHLNPEHPMPYLHRGVANLQLGQYDKAMEDYKNFELKSPPIKNPFVLGEFALAFAKAVPRGAIDSGKALGGFVVDAVAHPIRTCEQTWDVLEQLASLARTSEWEAISEVLVPEIHELVTDWDTKSSTEKGDLSGYVVGKYGSDILIPGAAGKLLGKGVQGAEHLLSASRGLKTAKEIYLLEAAGAVGENLGLSMEEGIINASRGIVTQTKEKQILKNSHSKEITHIIQDPSMLQSIELFKKAEEFLKSYNRQPLPEKRCRNLIHQTGIQTFPRPAGIPKDFKTMVTQRGAGIEYAHPKNPHVSVRVMPGKPHSPFANQQKPYVIHKKDGKALDKHGSFVSQDAAEAHIPFEEFIYRE